MTDRELLEMAAKAAGLDVVMTQPFIGLQIRSGNLWNPLNDDGDALRLACVLDVIIDIDLGEGVTSVDYTVKDADFCLCEVHAGNVESATRRAIVRAAAAIGESMP